MHRRFPRRRSAGFGRVVDFQYHEIVPNDQVNMPTVDEPDYMPPMNAPSSDQLFGYVDKTPSPPSPPKEKNEQTSNNLDSIANEAVNGIDILLDEWQLPTSPEQTPQPPEDQTEVDAADEKQRKIEKRRLEKKRFEEELANWTSGGKLDLAKIRADRLARQKEEEEKAKKL